MKHQVLQGWNITVEKKQIMVPNPDGAPGDMVPGEGWELKFTEMMPQTGDTIRFAFGRDVRDHIVRELTGGIVLHGGELPKI